MFRNVPGCSGMFHVPGFVDARFNARHFNKNPYNQGVNKTRNMEHPGTFRNIPEHPGTGQIITKQTKKKRQKESD